MKQKLYSGKTNEYFGQARQPVVEAIPPGRHRILEIGSGDGSTLIACKRQGRAEEIVGVELVESAATRSRRHLDEVHIGDVEQVLAESVEGPFDYIIAADVLEHLLDPWTVTRTLHEMLRPGGRLIATMPNVRNWRVLRDLVVLGKWNYVDAGILDRTHLRFFTAASMRSMLADADFEVMQMSSLGAKSARIANRLPRGLSEVATAQYLIVAQRQ